MAFAWFVVRVQTSKEYLARENLLKRVKAQQKDNLLSHVLIPTEKITEIRGGKKRVREVMKYPGYLFIRMDLTDDMWYLVRETPGIGEFLGRNRPVPMSDAEAEVMLAQDMKKEMESPSLKVSFRPGDKVRIKEGPFENYEGVVEEIVSAKGVVKVTLNIFGGRPTNVELEYWQVEPLE